MAEYVSREEVPEDVSAKVVTKRADYTETASDLVKATYPKAEFRMVDDHYVGTNGIAHVNFKQTVNGIDIDNADFNVNVSDLGMIVWEHTLIVNRLVLMEKSSPTETVSLMERCLAL
jgi:extracellular elastinolytic metalloproteinase